METSRINRGELLAEYLRHFSSVELVQLIQVLKRISAEATSYRVDHMHPREYFATRVGLKKFIKLVNYLMTGQFVVPPDKEAFLRDIEEVKRSLADYISRLNLTSGEAKSANAMKRPLELASLTKNGKVYGLTDHGWERFCYRYLSTTNSHVHEPELYSEDYFISRFKECWNRAVEEKLSKRGEVIRIIQNDFERAGYFKDLSTNLRFVVSEDGAIITVEIALVN